MSPGLLVSGSPSLPLVSVHIFQPWWICHSRLVGGCRCVYPHERWVSSSKPSLNDHLHYPPDIDRTLNEDTTDKTYNTVLITIIFPLTLFPLCLLLQVRLGVYTENLFAFYFYRLIGKLTAYFQIQKFSSANQLPLPPHGVLVTGQV